MINDEYESIYDECRWDEEGAALIVISQIIIIGEYIVSYETTPE